MTLAAIKHSGLIKYFKCFNPVYMFIDRATGYFDPAMGFKKDYIAVLSSLWRMSAAIHDFMVDPNETTVCDLRELGIDVYDPSEDQKEKRSELYKKAMKAPKEWRNRALIVGNAAEEYL